MMGIVMPETCWAYNNYNKITSSGFLFFSYHNDARSNKHQINGTSLLFSESAFHEAVLI